MDYGLAKQLKDAGFPQTGEGRFFVEGYSVPQILINFEDELILSYSPTLSELIEACGSNFNALSQIRDDHDLTWIATCHESTISGKTPEEAVAKLWLKLNEKA